MSKGANVNELFKTAAEEGDISPSTANALMVVDMGAEIQEGLGISVDDVEASEVVLVTIMPDDSGSIQDAGNEQAVRDGHNIVLEALQASKQKDNVLIHNRYLNGKVLYPYTRIDQAIRMDGRNYKAMLGTPLYDQAVVLLGTVIAKTQEFVNNAVNVRTVTLLITDGEDVHSIRANAAMVKSIVDDLQGENNIVAAMGIDDGRTDFKKVFREMGIKDQWILTPGNTESEIRQAFRVFSQSAVRASQSAASFSKLGAGGFGS